MSYENGAKEQSAYLNHRATPWHENELETTRHSVSAINIELPDPYQMTSSQQEGHQQDQHQYNPYQHEPPFECYDPLNPQAHLAPVPLQPLPQTKSSKWAALLFGIIGVVIGAIIVFMALLISGSLGKSHSSLSGVSSIELANSVNDDEQSLAEAVAQKCLPSVVSIRVYAENKNTTMDLYSKLFGNEENDSESSGPEVISMGSGVIIDGNGHVITNAHVVSEGTSFVVTFNGGETAEAKLIGADESTDLAILQVEVNGLAPMGVATAETVDVGEWVMAIGAPFGQEQSVSTGIVSAKYRSQTMQSASGVTFYLNLIQTDAAINPGNSGGALVNDKGELIGINSIISSMSGSYAGVGFAIPADYAINIANQIITTGKVSHPYLGVTLATVNAGTSATLGTKAKEGAYVNTVMKDSPAGKADIKKGDVILELNGKKITTASELIIAVRECKIGDEVTLKLLRGSDNKEVKVVLGTDD